jgi:hypothetical protein
MKIRPGWQPTAQDSGRDDGRHAPARGIAPAAVPAAASAPVQLVSASDMMLPQPHLSDARVDETRMLFQEFLEHLDRLGLSEPATHVSLAFERFLAMYPESGSDD